MPSEIERARAAFEAAKVEDTFWHAHHTELLEKYPDQFVAVFDGEVVATSPDLLELDELLEGKGLNSTRLWIKFMDADQDRVIIL